MNITEILKLISKLENYCKTAKSNIQKRYYENALKDLTQFLETMRCKNAE